VEQIPESAPWGVAPKEEENRMERDSREWLVPLVTGLGFVLLLIVSFVVTGEPKSADDGPAEVAEWYVDNKDAAEAGAFIGAVAAAFLIFFGAYLRSVLEGAGAMLATLPLIGLTIVGIAAAIDSTLLFAAAEAADDIPAPEVQTIQAIWDNDFVPFLLGVIIFNWSVGLAVLRSDVLPRWMGWLAIVFAVVSLAGPIGFIGALGGLIWIIIATVLLTMRARSGPATPATPAA
jgi:hypothetical protein